MKRASDPGDSEANMHQRNVVANNLGRIKGSP